MLYGPIASAAGVLLPIPSDVNNVRVRIYIAQLNQGMDSNYQMSVAANAQTNLFDVTVTSLKDVNQALKTLTFQLQLNGLIVSIKPETISVQFKVGATNVQYNGSKFYNGLSLMPASIVNPIQMMSMLRLRSSNNPTSGSIEFQYKGRYWTISDATGTLVTTENTVEDMSMIHIAKSKYGPDGKLLPAYISDGLKHGEHEQMLKLLKYVDNPDRIIKSGNWSDATIWEKGSVPAPDADVLIPEGLTVTIDGDFLSQPLHTIRVDGTINFLTNINTGLKVRTLIVNSMGSFIMGTATDRIQPGVTAQVLIRDRGIRDDNARLKDPLDIDGGVIAHGPVLSMYGEEKTAFSFPNQILRKGLSLLVFPQAPKGWHVGDTLIFPTTADPGSFNAGYWQFPDQDERIKISRVVTTVAGTMAVILESPLQYDHLAPVNMMDPNNPSQPLRIPVGNLTRNAFFKSEVSSMAQADLQRRGHFMVMHTQSGIVIDSAGFYDLGRTDATRIHTIPMLDSNGHTIPGTDANSQGRYALHIHGRTGADMLKSPILISNCAIVGSPKHGLVNHGSNVIATGNVTYNIMGSHFFSENGSEIGSFTKNLAIGSLGLIPKNGPHLFTLGAVNELTNNGTLPAFDMGGQGYGFWMQGGGVRVIGNYSFHHRDADYAYYALDIREGIKDATIMVDGQYVPFVPFQVSNLDVTDADGNVDLDKQAYKNQLISSGISTIRVSLIPIVFARNIGAAAPVGVIAKYLHESDATNNLYNKIQDSIFWANSGVGIVGNYSERLYLQRVTSIRDATNVNLASNPKWPTYGGGFGINFHTTSVIFDQVHFEGWVQGINVPIAGTSIVKDSFLKNKINISIADADSMETNVDVNFRHVLIQNNHFETLNQKGYSNEPSFDIFIGGRFVNNDPSQLPDASVWQSDHNPIEIKDQDMSALRIGTDYVPDLFYDRFYITLQSPKFTNQTTPYVATAKQEAYGAILYSAPVTLSEGWNNIPITVPHWTSDCVKEPVGCHDQVRTVMVYRDTTPPTFVNDPDLQLTMNIDDPSSLANGFVMRGTIVDQVGNMRIEKSYTQNFPGLAPDASGKLNIKFNISDALGNTTSILRYVMPTRTDESILKDMEKVIRDHNASKTAPDQYIAGFDLNGDKQVDASDQIMMRNMWTLDTEKWSAASTKFLGEVRNRFGVSGSLNFIPELDINRTGAITVVDYLRIRNVLAHGRT